MSLRHRAFLSAPRALTTDRKRSSELRQMSKRAAGPAARHLVCNQETGVRLPGGPFDNLKNKEDRRAARISGGGRQQTTQTAATSSSVARQCEEGGGSRCTFASACSAAARTLGSGYARGRRQFRNRVRPAMDKCRQGVAAKLPDTRARISQVLPQTRLSNRRFRSEFFKREGGMHSNLLVGVVQLRQDKRKRWVSRSQSLAVCGPTREDPRYPKSSLNECPSMLGKRRRRGADHGSKREEGTRRNIGARPKGSNRPS